MMIQNKKVLLIVILSFFIITSCSKYAAKTYQSETYIEFSLDQVNTSINKAIDFLYESQLDYGEFETYACKDRGMTDCYFDSSPFVTTFVLYSIKDVQDSRVRLMTNKGISFLLAEKEPGGIWKYWSSRNYKEIEPDLDDTAVISDILRRNRIDFEDNSDIIENNRNDEGLFYTWLDKNPEDNDVDCAVNTNVLLYLGENDAEVCSYINNAIEKDEDCSIYYPDKFSLYYMVSRAFMNNISCFNENKNIIIERVLSKQEDDGSFGNPLQTALAVNTLINYGYTETEIDHAIGYLVKHQNNNGSWPKEIFFIGAYFEDINFGSEELTTAIVVEALNKYILIQE
tara:strand:- start:4095 stop:5120 length:1026 start_codon:yes stop_codon:yes gene_type:complete